MALWLETFVMVLIAGLGIWLGLSASKRSARAQIIFMSTAFFIICLILLARQNTLWPSMPFLCPLAAGRIRFVFLTLAVTIGLSAPIGQLSNRLSRCVTCVVMTVLTALLISLPFMMPALLQEHFSSAQTRIDIDGVCRQTLPYTCGPAAAVTALNRLGFEAGEGTLALQARTCPIIGTSPWDLYRAIKNTYSQDGLFCNFAMMTSLDQIPAGGILLAIVNDHFALDHCVAVLSFNERTVTLADPAEGLIHMPRWQFNQQWRNCGIVLQKTL